jgi:hypothetical protein
MVTLFGDRAHNSRGQSRTQSECRTSHGLGRTILQRHSLLLAGRELRFWIRHEGIPDYQGCTGC